MAFTLTSRTRRLLPWALILVAWTLIVTTFSVQAYVFAIARGRPDNFWH